MSYFFTIHILTYIHLLDSELDISEFQSRSALGSSVTLGKMLNILSLHFLIFKVKGTVIPALVAIQRSNEIPIGTQQTLTNFGLFFCIRNIPQGLK